MNKSTLSVRLDEILKEKEISIAEAATKTKLSRQALYDLRSGRVTGIQFETLEKLCRGLNVEPCELFTVTKKQ